MFIKLDENKNLEIVWISADLYKRYEQQRLKLKTCEYYLKDAQNKRDGFKDALRQISLYNGNNKDSLQLKEIANNALIEFDPDIY
jgi:hypothetical protein